MQRQLEQLCQVIRDTLSGRHARTEESVNPGWSGFDTSATDLEAFWNNVRLAQAMLDPLWPVDDRNLRTLSLSSINLKCKDLTYLLRHADLLPQLQELDLTSNQQIDDDSAATLRELVNGLIALEHLGLAKTGIGKSFLVRFSRHADHTHQGEGAAVPCAFSYHEPATLSCHEEPPYCACRKWTSVTADRGDGRCLRDPGDDNPPVAYVVVRTDPDDLAQEGCMTRSTTEQSFQDESSGGLPPLHRRGVLLDLRGNALDTSALPLLLRRRARITFRAILDCNPNGDVLPFMFKMVDVRNTTRTRDVVLEKVPLLVVSFPAEEEHGSMDRSGAGRLSISAYSNKPPTPRATNTTPSCKTPPNSRSSTPPPQRDGCRESTPTMGTSLSTASATSQTSTVGKHRVEAHSDVSAAVSSISPAGGETEGHTPARPELGEAILLSRRGDRVESPSSSSGTSNTARSSRSIAMRLPCARKTTVESARVSRAESRAHVAVRGCSNVRADADDRRDRFSRGGNLRGRQAPPRISGYAGLHRGHAN